MRYILYLFTVLFILAISMTFIDIGHSETKPEALSDWGNYVQQYRDTANVIVLLNWTQSMFGTNFDRFKAKLDGSIPRQIKRLADSLSKLYELNLSYAYFGIDTAGNRQFDFRNGFIKTGPINRGGFIIGDWNSLVNSAISRNSLTLPGHANGVRTGHSVSKQLALIRLFPEMNKSSSKIYIIAVTDNRSNVLKGQSPSEEMSELWRWSCGDDIPVEDKLDKDSFDWAVSTVKKLEDMYRFFNRLTLLSNNTNDNYPIDVQLQELVLYEVPGDLFYLPESPEFEDKSEQEKIITANVRAGQNNWGNSRFVPVAYGYKIIDDGSGQIIRDHKENIDTNSRDFSVREEIPKTKSSSYSLNTMLYVRSAGASDNSDVLSSLSDGLILKIENDSKVCEKVSKIAGIVDIKNGLLTLSRKTGLLRPSVLAGIANVILSILIISWLCFILSPYILPSVPDVEFELRMKK